MSSIMDVIGKVGSVGTALSSAVSPFGQIAGSLGLIGSLFGLGKKNEEKAAQQQFEYQKYLQEQNIAMQKETNAQQLQMFDKNLDWQRESQQIQNQFNLDQWQRSFDATNEYNSPGAQVARLISAGLDPQLAAGTPALAGQNTSPSSGVGASGSGIPGLHAPTFDVRQETPDMMSIAAQQGTANSINQISQAIAAISQGAQSTATTHRTQTLLSAELEKLFAERDVLEQDELSKEIQNNLDSYFGFTDRDLNQKLVTQSISESLARCKLAEQQGDLFVAERYLADARKALTDSELDVSKKKLHYLDEYLDLQNRNLRQDIRNKMSQEAYNYSGVSLNKTQEQLNSAMAGYYSVMQTLYDYESKLRKNELTVSDRTLEHQVTRYLNECEEQGYVTQWQKQHALIALEQLNQAKFETDHQAISYWSGQLHQVLGDAANLISSIKGTGSMPYNVNSTSPQSETWTYEEEYPMTVNGRKTTGKQKRVINNYRRK